MSVSLRTVSRPLPRHNFIERTKNGKSKGISGGDEMIESIAAAILHLVLVISPCPRCEMAVDEAARVSLADAIVRVSLAEGLDPFLVLSVAFNESSLDASKVGALGEVGLLQLMPSRLAVCEMAGIDTTTWEGKLLCGARHLAHEIKVCGTVAAGIGRYGSGDVCSYKITKKAAYRIWLAARLRKAVE